MSASTPRADAAYRDGCVKPLDNPDVSGAWGTTSNKFKFRQNIDTSRSKLVEDNWFKPAVGDESLDELSVRSFSVNTDKKVQWVCDMYRDWWFCRVSQVECDSRINGQNLKIVRMVPRPISATLFATSS